MSADHLRLHRFLPASRVNGPGLRAVIWVQGCSLGCPSCFNPETHAENAGELVPIERLAEKILANKAHLEGLTLSGGEPFQQAFPVAALLRLIRANSSLSVLIFSGYTWSQLQRNPAALHILTNTDVLLAGRYLHPHRVASGLLGSSNKTVHFLTSRYKLADLQDIPEAEIILEPDGDVLLSGIDPLQW